MDTSKGIMGGFEVGAKTKTPNPFRKETDAQIKSKIEKQNKESIKRLKDKMKDKDPEDLAGGGLAGMLGERTGYENGKYVTGADIRRQDRKDVAERSWIKPQILYDEEGNRIPTFGKTGKQQIEGALEGNF